MFKMNHIAKGAFALAVIALSAQCTPKKTEESIPAVELTPAEVTLPVAFVNVDSLLLNYNYAKDLNEALLRKQENSRVSINQKGKALEREVTDFQKKLQNNAFLTEQRAQQEATRLQKQEADLNELSQRLNNELMIEQQKMNTQLNDSIQNFLKIYNAEKKYEFIFSNTMGDNILIAQPKYDITNEVVEELNKRYQPEAK